MDIADKLGAEKSNDDYIFELGRAGLNLVKKEEPKPA